MPNHTVWHIDEERQKHETQHTKKVWLQTTTIPADLLTVHTGYRVTHVKHVT